VEEIPHSKKRSGAKGSPFAALREVFLGRKEIIRKIRDFDWEDSPRLQRKIIRATTANFYQSALSVS
jgi:hypothetical protein